MNIFIRSSRDPRKKANDPQVENHCFKDLLPCYCYTVKTNSITAARELRNLLLQAMERTQLVTA